MDIQKKLVKFCSALNRLKIKYVVIGGCAVILHGYKRTTFDIDILVDHSSENIEALKKALNEIYKTKEASNIDNDDLEKYAVVRFAPESEDVVIDIMRKVGDIDFDSASKNSEVIILDGVEIPVCGLSVLIETKKGVRPKDKEDLLFLLGKKEFLEKMKSS